MRLRRLSDSTGRSRPVVLVPRVGTEISQVAAGVVDVVSCRPAQARHLFIRKATHDLAGGADDERAVGDLLALGDERVGADETFATDDGMVEDHRLDAD